MQTTNSLGEFDVDVPRLNTRLAVELFIDSFELYDEPRALFDYLREKGFCPELLRAKGYLSLPFVVGVIPAYSTNLRRLASISVRRNLDDVSKDAVTAAGTIVTVDAVMTPVDFTLLRVDGGKVVANGPVSFDDLAKKGFEGVLKELKINARKVLLTKITRGRALAPLVLDDLVGDELQAGFLTQSEASRVLSNAELSADIARLHAYVSEAVGAKAGCSGCCSSSCFGCTSCSCFIFGGKKKASNSPT